MSKVSFLASARTRTRARVARGAVGRAAVSARPAVYARTKHKTKRIVVSLSLSFLFFSLVVVVPASIAVARQPTNPAKVKPGRSEGGSHVTVYPYRRRSPSIHPPSRDNPEKGANGNDVNDADAPSTPTHRRRRRRIPPCGIPTISSAAYSQTEPRRHRRTGSTHHSFHPSIDGARSV